MDTLRSILENSGKKSLSVHLPNGRLIGIIVPDGENMYSKFLNLIKDYFETNTVSINDADFIIGDGVWVNLDTDNDTINIQILNANIY